MFAKYVMGLEKTKAFFNYLHFLLGKKTYIFLTELVVLA